MSLRTVLPRLDEQTNKHLLIIGNGYDAARVMASRFAAAADVVILSNRIGGRLHGVRCLESRQLNFMEALGKTPNGAYRLCQLLSKADALANPDAIEEEELPPESADADSLDAPVAQVITPFTQPKPGKLLPGRAMGNALAKWSSSRRTLLPQESNVRKSARMIPLRFKVGCSIEDAVAAIQDLVQTAGEREFPMPLAETRPGRLIDIRELKLDLQRGAETHTEHIKLLVPVRERDDWIILRNAGFRPELNAVDRREALSFAAEMLRKDKPRLPADAIDDIIKADAEDIIWDHLVEQAKPVTKQALPGTRALLDALRESPSTREVATTIEHELAGRFPAPRWWQEEGVWSVSTSDATPLRRALLIESLMEAADDVSQLGNPKAVIVHDPSYFEDPLALDSLLALIRTGRKLHIFVVVIADAIPPQVMRGLIATWIVSPEHLDQLSSVPAVTEQPTAWLITGDSHVPEPLGIWYTQAEVAAGDQVISTASPAAAFKEPDHE